MNIRDILISFFVGLIIGSALVYWYDHRGGQVIHVGGTENLPPTTLQPGQKSTGNNKVKVEEIKPPVDASACSGVYKHSWIIPMDGPHSRGEISVWDLVSDGGRTSAPGWQKNYDEILPADPRLGLGARFGYSFAHGNQATDYFLTYRLMELGPARVDLFYETGTNDTKAGGEVKVGIPPGLLPGIL